MNQINSIFSKVIGIPESEIKNELSRNDTEAWDSFNHLLLISEIEKTMGIKFTISEVEQIKTFRDLNKIINIRCKE